MLQSSLQQPLTHTGPLVWPQLEAHGGAEAACLPLDLLAAVLTVGQGTGP